MERGVEPVGPDQLADQLVGGVALAGEQNADAAGRRRQAVHPFGPVEHHGDLVAGLCGDPAEAGDQPLALLLQGHLGEAALGDVVTVDHQVRPR